MGRWLVVAVVALAAFAGCKTVARGEIWEDAIEEQLKEAGKDADVDCPDAIPLGRVAENQFECEITWRGGVTRVLVRVNEKLGWEYHPI